MVAFRQGDFISMVNGGIGYEAHPRLYCLFRYPSRRLPFRAGGSQPRLAAGAGVPILMPLVTGLRWSTDAQGDYWRAQLYDGPLCIGIVGSYYCIDPETGVRPPKAEQVTMLAEYENVRVRD